MTPFKPPFRNNFDVPAITLPPLPGETDAERAAIAHREEADELLISRLVAVIFSAQGGGAFCAL